MNKIIRGTVRTMVLAGLVSVLTITILKEKKEKK